MSESRESNGRRDFLRVATAGGVAGASVVGLTSCFRALRPGDAPPLDRVDVDRRLALLGRGLEALESRRLVTELRGDEGRDPELARSLRHADELTRRALRSLLFLAIYIELPDETRAHPDVVAWVDRFQPELSETLADSALLLSTFPRDELARVGSTLRAHPDQVMALCEVLHTRNRQQGLGSSSRRLLRAAGRRLTNALRRAPMDAVLGECLSAFECVLEDHGVAAATLYDRDEADLHRVFLSPRGATSKEEVRSAPAAPAPCVVANDQGYVIGPCERSRPHRPPGEGAQYEEYLRWQAQIRGEGRPRRRNVGLGLTISGSILLAGCGAGIFLLIPGIILMATSGRGQSEELQ